MVSYGLIDLWLIFEHFEYFLYCISAIDDIGIGVGDGGGGICEAGAIHDERCEFSGCELATACDYHLPPIP